MPKPAIFISGNCNAAVLRNAFGRVGTLTDVAELFHVPNCYIDYWPEPMREAFGRCSILIVQTTTDAAEFVNWITRAAPKGCRIIRFPPAIYTSFWPLGFNDPRNEITRTIVTPEGLYPHCLANSEVLRLVNNGCAPAEAAQRFLAEFSFNPGILDRFHELSISNQRNLDRNGDLAIADYIAQNLARERLFIAPSHPGGPLFAELFRQLAASIGLNPPSLIQDVVAQLQNFIGVGAYDAPIHPQIATHFKLRWADGILYRHFHEGHFNHDEYVRRYADLKYCHDYYEGFHLLDLGRPQAALPYLESAVQQNPNAPRFQEQLIRTMDGLCPPDQRLQVSQSAVDACPEDGMLWLLHAQAASAAGDPQRTIYAAEKAIAKNIEPACAWHLIATAYGAIGNISMADQAARTSHWQASLPASPRPLVGLTGAEFGRWQMGFGANGF
jgi:tetratricopeptide (TPR) repeat protein